MVDRQFTFPVATDHQPGGWHSAYIEIYKLLFSRWERAAPVVLLEIGTAGGGGLRAYQDYFPNGYILGIDIHAIPDGVKGQPRIVHMQDDAYTMAKVNELALSPRFDIQIDDGPHSIESQEFFVQHYPNLLGPGGVAIVEDVQAPEHIARLARLVPPEFFAYGIDLTMHDGGRYDNRILVIQRR